MTVKQLTEKNTNFILAAGDGSREIKSVYCCDLLSVVMGRAQADCAWVTVMGAVNSVAVAVLADVACVVIAEGCAFDENARERAEQQGITVLKTTLPVFEAALRIKELCLD